MKTNKIAVMIFVCILPLFSFAWKEFHGGDSVKIQWNILAAGIMADADKVPVLKKYSELFLSSFFETELITTEDDLRLDGVEKVALFEMDRSNGQKTLYININRWNQLSESEREYLIIHELLNMSSLIDDDYHFSRGIYTHLMKARTILSKYNNLYSFVYEGFGQCSIANYKEVLPLMAEKTALAEIAIYIDGNPKFCSGVVSLSERIKKLLSEVENEQQPGH